MMQGLQAEASKLLINVVREWLLTSPFFMAKDDILIDNLQKDVTEFALFSVPTEKAYDHYFDGTSLSIIQKQNFVLATRNYYGIEKLENLRNLEFYDNLSEWMSYQKEFPTYNKGEITNILINNTPTLMEVAGNRAKYQVQGVINYRRKKDVT